MGEAWHNNHHAYPGSARLGLHKDEPDPGWWVLNKLHKLGVVKNVKLPKDLPHRSEVVPLEREIKGTGKREQSPLNAQHYKS